MEREEKVRETENKRQEIMGRKLKRGVLVGKRGGPCTPSPKWIVGFAQPDGSIREDLTFPVTTTFSARKLGANLWEVLPHLEVAKMSKGGARFRHHHYKDKGFEFESGLAEPPDSPLHQPAGANGLSRRVAASLIQRPRLVERNDHAPRPVSPASYSSSMEVAPYNPAGTPVSSLDFKGHTGESTLSFKTSAELLKVLNRIWTLEEQHASNMLLVKELKRELNLSRARIKELLQEKQSKQWSMDDLMKQAAEEKIVRKSKEQARIRAAVQSVRDELEDERKLRQHSESLHRKLAREISEMKSSFSNVLKELGREKKARILLEDLCDEFAKGIRDYEQEVRSLRHKSDKDRFAGENPDRLILHISEAWLDERTQMKLAESRSNLPEKNTIVDKLSSEIETFLQAKRSVCCRSSDNLSSKRLKERSLRRHSLESFHLKEATSAPRNVDDEDSSGNDSHCFELGKGSSEKQGDSDIKQHEHNVSEDHVEFVKSNPSKKKIQSRDKSCDLSTSQIQLEEHAARSVCNGNRNQITVGEQGEKGIADPVGVTNSQMLETSDAPQECLVEGKNKQGDFCSLNSNHMPTNINRNHSSSLEGGKQGPESKSMEDACSQPALPDHASPVQQQVSRFTSTDPEISESSSRWPHGVKENTLKAKLLEARLESQQSRSKASKGSF